MSIFVFMIPCCIYAAIEEAYQKHQNRPRKPHVYRKADY